MRLSAIMLRNPNRGRVNYIYKYIYIFDYMVSYGKNNVHRRYGPACIRE